MRIIQILPTISYGDAVSNDTFAIDKIIKSMGFNTEIYAESVGKNLPVKNINKMKSPSKDDIIIYHMSTGTNLNFSINKLNCRKIMIYHNITPPEFFRPYNHEMFALTNYGYQGLKFLKNTFELCIADSEYNKLQLIKYGYKCPIKVCPIIIPFKDYKKVHDPYIIKNYSDNWTNIIFVGRIAPNKKYEDIIRTFYYYKKINPKSRLILVGSWTGMESYYNRLKKYILTLELNDVIFTGHITFDKILSYYKIADIFLCMSQHEGFCVPLVEAMFFNIPIIALNAGAVSDTLGKSGVLISSNNSFHIAEKIDQIVNNIDFRNNILKQQQKRLSYFSYKKTGSLFKEILSDFINDKY